jgi:ribonuclease/clavin/mitogillin
MKNSLIEAVSAVFVNPKKEIFMVKRQNFLKAFPGYHAFPGGKVDQEDFHQTTQLAVEGFPNTLSFDLKLALIVALCREVKEELNFFLAESKTKNTTISIHYLGLAVTPDFNPYRFNTHFFLIELASSDVSFTIDLNEAATGEWRNPKDFLNLYHSGKMLLVPPILNLLKQLDNDPTIKLVDNFDFNYDQAIHVPWIESLYHVKQLMPLSNTLPPAERTNAFVIGAGAETLLIDPSPKNELELKKLLQTLKQFKIGKVFLTHHHFDHVQYSSVIAKQLNVPILVSSDSMERIKNKYAQNFFKEVKVIQIKDGDVIGKWLDQDILVMAIPGHDRGHLGLYSKDLSWFIVGDLIQGIGTVVVGGEEGDMTEYFFTLKKVIQLNPHIIFPSHGIPTGGVNRLIETLKHRQEREEQVFQGLNIGKSIDQILGEIYHQIDPQLLPYAKINIESHYKKLKKEGRIS